MAHVKNNGKEVHKRGMSVDVKPGHTPDQQARNMENAIKTLKRRMMQEGVLKELRAREYFESKGIKKRKALAEARSRENKARRLALQK
jgi:ribosomal protein S21